jgi:hypothetical protein
MMVEPATNRHCEAAQKMSGVFISFGNFSPVRDVCELLITSQVSVKKNT